MNQTGSEGMWAEEDSFYYDVLRHPDGSAQRLEVRSMVGRAFSPSRVIGENLSVVRNPRDREIGKTVVDEFLVSPGIHIHKDELKVRPCELCGVTRSHNRSAALGPRQSGQLLLSAIHANSDLSIIPDAVDGAVVAVGNLQVPVRSRKLNFVSNGKQLT